jgi:hypothetical protein
VQNEFVLATNTYKGLQTTMLKKQNALNNLVKKVNEQNLGQYDQSPNRIKSKFSGSNSNSKEKQSDYNPKVLKDLLLKTSQLQTKLKTDLIETENVKREVLKTEQYYGASTRSKTKPNNLNKVRNPNEFYIHS